MSEKVSTFFSEYVFGLCSFSVLVQIFNVEFLKTIFLFIIQLVITILIRFLFNYLQKKIFKNEDKESGEDNFDRIG